MSTRSCIARATGEGKFTGVYHHWDGYPAALGETWERHWKALHGHFKGDLHAMLHYFIDEHPAGWSTINDCDYSVPAGYSEFTGKTFTKKHKRTKAYMQWKKIPQCYCHGGRHENAELIDQDTDAEMEWAYVFDAEKRVMYVLERVYTDNAESARPCRVRRSTIWPGRT